MSHFIKKCICGNILAQCKCMGQKVVEVVTPCNCKIPAMPPYKTDALDTELRARLFDVLNCYEIDASEISHGTTYIDSTEAKRLVDRIIPYIQTHYLSREAVREASNALRLDLYHIQPDELDEIVSRCEGKHIQQVVYSTYHKGFTRICFGCMQVDTTIKQALGLEGDS